MLSFKTKPVNIVRAAPTPEVADSVTLPNVPKSPEIPVLDLLTLSQKNDLRFAASTPIPPAVPTLESTVAEPDPPKRDSDAASREAASREQAEAVLAKRQNPGQSEVDGQPQLTYQPMPTGIVRTARRPQAPRHVRFASVAREPRIAEPGRVARELATVFRSASQVQAQDDAPTEAPPEPPADAIADDRPDLDPADAIPAPDVYGPTPGGPALPPMVEYMPAYTCPVEGVYCDGCCEHHRPRWRDATLIPWDVFAQGEYVGPARTVHVPEYRLRVDDTLDFIFRITAEASTDAYEFNVGDELRIESITEEELDRTVLVQPDGNITVHLLGQVRAAGRTIESLRADLEKQYKEFVKEPALTVTPLVMNTRLAELRNAIDSRFGEGGQSLRVRVTPEGTVQLPALGSVPAHGLSINELKREVDRRYARLIFGMEVTPVLVARAPRFVYVLGSVGAPGRYELTGPTTVMQAMSLAGSYVLGANLKHVVIFRRDEHWQLMATHVDMNHLRWGNKPCPAGELWVRDSDVILVPQRPLENANQIIEHLFTRGLYSVFPVDFRVGFAKLSTI